MLAYRKRYGYSMRGAIVAEFWWRVEHCPLRQDGQPLAQLARRAYGRRKAAERRYSPLLRSGS